MAMAAVKPGGPEHKCRRVCMARASSTHTRWADSRNLFGISGRLSAVEHVIGGNMDERNGSSLGLRGKLFRPVSIDGKCAFGFRFGLVHRCVCRSVDNRAWLDRPHDRLDGSRIFKIELRTPDRDPRKPRCCADSTKQRGQLFRFPANENPAHEVQRSPRLNLTVGPDRHFGAAAPTTLCFPDTSLP